MKHRRAPQVTPLQRLYRRLEFLGRILMILCCLWIAAVADVLTDEAPPDLIPNHRSAVIQEQIGRCEGAFSLRFTCTGEILTKGSQDGIMAIAQRLMAILLLPVVAWTMWNGVMAKARRLRSDNPAVPHQSGHPALHAPNLPPTGTAPPTIHAAE